MNKHTPGPWQYIAPIGSDDFSVHAFDRAHTCKMIRVAHVPNTIYNGMHGWPEHCERHANARLICAAPDLLDALEQLIEFIEPIRFDRKSDDNRAIALEVAGRAAIARARGEA